MTHNEEARDHLSPPAHTEAIRQSPHDGSAPGRSPAEEQSTDALFYWELPEGDANRLRQHDLILEDEGYLAHDILWGRRLLDLRHDYVPIPDVDPDWNVPGSSERFTDAIAAILQVAVRAGLDSETLCEAALATRVSVESFSAAAASHRGLR